MKITIDNAVEGDLIALIPSFLVSGEPGDPLSDFVITLINNMAILKYWPLDFGEDHGTHIELHFSRASTTVEAYESAKHFIDKGGDV